MYHDSENLGKINVLIDKVWGSGTPESPYSAHAGRSIFDVLKIAEVASDWLKNGDKIFINLQPYTFMVSQNLERTDTSEPKLHIELFRRNEDPRLNLEATNVVISYAATIYEAFSRVLL